MRRERHGSVEHADAKVILQCPTGHELGYLIVSATEPDRLRLGGGPGWDRRDALEHPLSMTCQQCEARGQRFDLRGSWDKVRALARELQQDRARSKSVYRLGGIPR